jgi:hypothetical protein
MFKNLNIIIVLLIIVLIIAYFCNNYEGFATNNDEAIATVASVYNKDNMTVTNLSATNNLSTNNLNVGGACKLSNMTWHSSADGQVRFLYYNNDRTVFRAPKGHEWRATNDAVITTLNEQGDLNVTGVITSPTINAINEKNAALESRISTLENNTRVAARRMYSRRANDGKDYDIFNLQGMVIPNLNCHGTKHKHYANGGCSLFNSVDGGHIPFPSEWI